MMSSARDAVLNPCTLEASHVCLPGETVSWDVNRFDVPKIVSFFQSV